jgi:acyl dehydratase
MSAVLENQVQLHFEDVAVGDELPALRKGPLTTAHLMRWSAAIENWHKIHYDEKFSMEHDKLPGLVVKGTLLQQFTMQFLKDWAGLEGWAWKAKYQFRAMVPVGSCVEIWGRAKRRIELADYGLAEIEIGMKCLGSEAVEAAPGIALVALPYQAGKAVPYPFVPPRDDPWLRTE